MTENELKSSSAYKSYCAKKGAVMRLAKKCSWLNVWVTDYSTKPGREKKDLISVDADAILRDGLWNAVQKRLVSAGWIGEGMEFRISSVTGWEYSHYIGEVNF